MKPGYEPNIRGLPDIPLTTSTAISNTSYVFSDIYSQGTCVQVGIAVKATLNVGTTSVEIKFQQGFSNNASDDFFDSPLADTANKTTVSNEYIVTCKGFVIRLDASTAGNNLGPFPFPLLFPYYRVAYKVTGVGTANVGIVIARTKI